MLTTTKEILLKAQQGKYAVGHFNTSNLEFTQAIIEAAVEMQSPVIIATSVKAMEYAHLAHISTIVRMLAQEAPVPVALHLDHGPNIEWTVKALAHGYSSIMIDASSLPYSDNIKLTKEVVALCNSANIPVEAELGQLKGVEDDVHAAEHVYTDPALAADFVAQTGCSSLAVAIGTSHGAYKFKGASKLDFERLKKIRELVSVPLVLHGASGVPHDIVAKAQHYGTIMKDAEGVSDEDIKTAISLGICKVNTDTDVRLAFTAAAREFYVQHPDNFDPRAMLAYTRDAVKQVVKNRIALFGSAHKA